MTWGWPQFAVAGVFLDGMGVSLGRYGQQKRDKYDIIDVFLAPALMAWLLYMGGFWR